MRREHLARHLNHHLARVLEAKGRALQQEGQACKRMKPCARTHARVTRAHACIMPQQCQRNAQMRSMCCASRSGGNAASECCCALAERGVNVFIRRVRVCVCVCARACACVYMCVHLCALFVSMRVTRATSAKRLQRPCHPLLGRACTSEWLPPCSYEHLRPLRDSKRP